ncbi:flagellar assembly protein FliW [Quadrisphaera sp. DSM 44207]|uniref:flagellar assembly protein FliW n=1 Tax=Quadrisphaera sp. DSM 44207 TaxID=1881057 RepID=UPI00088F1A29|nr:flagellar assembly protein FliW [Quadrisphaera sp. DSM 44207]SDQ20486.1 flagellar assembly factor FliW [Quadrisphaera sp. DSM 44207]
MSTPAAPAPAADLPELSFVLPLPGFEHLTRFALVQLEEDSPLFSLQSLEDGTVSLLVLAPGAVFPDYSPELDVPSQDALELTRAEDALLLVVVRSGRSLADSTANLLAPIVVNTSNRRAGQVVLTGSDHPLQAPLAA